MGDILKPGLVLLVITLIAGVCLGYVYDITKVPIENQQKQIMAKSMKEIIPDATEFKAVEDIKKTEGITSCVAAYKDGNIIGYVIGVSTTGYSGNIDTLVGINGEDAIEGIKIVKQTETPGLGANAKNPKFTNQYIGKNAKMTVVKTVPADNEIQAITSATITSNAVTKGVNMALEYYNNNLK